jgi:hypothetical protein
MAVPTPTPESDEVKTLLLSDRGCVAFLGAGVAIPPATTWKGLVNDIARGCAVHFDDSVPIGEYPAIIDQCISADEGACNAVLRDSLPHHTVISRTAVDYLNRFPFKAILTTNFDPWIQQHSHASQYDKGVHIYPDLPLTGGAAGNIYYLHGYFDSTGVTATIRNLILGKQSFEDAYERSPLLSGFLLNLFVYENILFVAFNPTERYVSALLKQSIELRKRIAGGNTKKRFLLLPTLSSDPVEKARQVAFINEVKSLDILPVYYDGSLDNHVGLEELLLTWLNESDLKDRPAPFKTGFDVV